LAAPALVLAVLSLNGEKRRARYYAERLAAPVEGRLPPATVIVPVKGLDQGLADNLLSLASLDYPDYELIVVARGAGDVPAGVVPDGARVVLARDGDRQTSEKIVNLLAAVAAARESSEILAFADSDGRARRGWLKALASPLGDEKTGATTGYRWHVPPSADFWPLARSVWNAVIAGRYGPGPSDFAWGGAMAIRKDTFVRCRVPDFWRGAVSDDYRLSDAVQRAGLEIRFAPGAMVASSDHTTAAEFLGWIRRQMVITRAYRPRLWWVAFVAHLIYCAATVACFVALGCGNLVGLAVLSVLWGLGMWKGANRARLARMALPEHEAWFRRHRWVHTWWVPFGTWLWMYSLAASALGRTIEWRGRLYRLS
jgi:cellulose synthase/poly-beta-1,6-N-acetylglucosamine synthase-like glycosyltransferase